jgi:hypothetical protein
MKANKTKGKVKLVKAGPCEVALLFPKGTAVRLRQYVPLDALLAVIHCPTADVAGQELDILEELEVGCQTVDC